MKKTMEEIIERKHKEFIEAKNHYFKDLNESLEKIYSLYEAEEIGEAPEGSVAAPAVAGSDKQQSALPQPLDNVAKSNYLNIIRTLLSYCQDNFAKMQDPSIVDLSNKIIKTTKIDASNAPQVDSLIETLLTSLNKQNFPKTSLD